MRLWLEFVLAHDELEDMIDDQPLYTIESSDESDDSAASIMSPASTPSLSGRKRTSEAIKAKAESEIDHEVHKASDKAASEAKSAERQYLPERACHEVANFITKNYGGP